MLLEKSTDREVYFYLSPPAWASVSSVNKTGKETAHKVRSNDFLNLSSSIIPKYNNQKWLDKEPEEYLDNLSLNIQSCVKDGTTEELKKLANLQTIIKNNIDNLTKEVKAQLKDLYEEIVKANKILQYKEQKTINKLTIPPAKEMARHLAKIQQKRKDLEKQIFA